MHWHSGLEDCCSEPEGTTSIFPSDKNLIELQFWIDCVLSVIPKLWISLRPFHPFKYETMFFWESSLQSHAVDYIWHVNSLWRPSCYPVMQAVFWGIRVALLIPDISRLRVSTVAIKSGWGFQAEDLVCLFVCLGLHWLLPPLCLTLLFCELSIYRKIQKLITACSVYYGVSVK